MTAKTGPDREAAMGIARSLRNLLGKDIPMVGFGHFLVNRIADAILIAKAEEAELWNSGPGLRSATLRAQISQRKGSDK
jgi:hypothetical protein